MGKKLTKAQEQEVLLTSKALFQKLQENRQKILVVDWYKDEQTRAKVKSTIEEVLDAQNPPHLPDCYDIDLFNVKSNLLLNHFIDMAVQGYGWARGGHYTLKIVKRVMVSHKILATFIVHRLHDELGDLRSIGCFGRLYPYHNHEVICLQI